MIWFEVVSLYLSGRTEEIHEDTKQNRLSVLIQNVDLPQTSQ